MKTINKGNIFDIAINNSAICVTTNGIIKKNGGLVMGAGIAKQVADLIPNAPFILGKYVKQYGNRCFKIGTYKIKTKYANEFVIERKITFVSFPTKHHWKDKSDIKLIEISAKQIKEMADKFGWTKIYMTPPGCGCGGLIWNEVKSIIENILDDRFIVVLNK